jgi:hypothetical protein
MALALCTKVESMKCLLASWWCDSEMGGSPVHIVAQGAVWSSVYVNIQEGKVAD